jgi:hypothetical protein
MANTYTLIAGTTLGTAAANIDFSSIPSTYTDLCLKVSFRSAKSALYDGLYIKLNNSSTTFTYRAIQGNGAAASSFSGTVGYAGDLNANTSTASTFASAEIYIPNYTASQNKSMSIDAVGETNATTIYSHLVASLWSTTTAINQVTVYTQSASNLMAYTSAYLYGIKNS